MSYLLVFLPKGLKKGVDPQSEEGQVPKR
jgi:hypothetical protein